MVNFRIESFSKSACSNVVCGKVMILGIRRSELREMKAGSEIEFSLMNELQMAVLNTIKILSI